MNLSKDMVPIISKRDIDKEAAKFLKKYCQEALDQPMPVPVEDIAELEMGLDIDYVHIDKNCETLGMMLFSDGPVELYDMESDQYIRRRYSKGTLLVARELAEVGNAGRERFTIAHEMVHWDKHQMRFLMLSFKDKATAKAARCPRSKTYTHKKKTPDDWMEWQADNLAAAILMPASMFRKKAWESRSQYKIGKTDNGYIWRGGYPPSAVTEFVVDDLANTFKVSKQAAEIRLNNLGIRLAE